MREQRQDGTRTRVRLLDAACDVFAERGYRKARVADICERADANVAAVNYHFGSKSALYAEAWRRAFEEAMRVYPPDGGLPADAPAEDRLRARIRTLLLRIFDDGRLGCFSNLLLMELANPTAAIEADVKSVLRPQIREFRLLLRDLLGEDASEEAVVLCHMSVINQCLALGFRRRVRRIFLGRERLSRQQVEAVAEHIATFSLAGIRAARDGAAASVLGGAAR